MTSYPLQLTTPQKDTLDDIVDEIKKFDWEIGEYVFHDFIQYFQLPQIIRIRDSRTFILPDWFQGQCRILSSNPIYKPRWWEFTNAVELLRFQMPRPHIRLLVDTPALLLLPTNQTIPVLMKENTEVTLKRLEKSNTITAGKEMFVLGDKNDQEFLLDPTQTTSAFHFAIKILDDEFDKSYHRDTEDNLFSLPEIIIRYELPIDIEITSLANTVPIENFPLKLRLEKFSVAKSIIAFSIGDSNHPRIWEFSSMTQFSLHCVKCLTTGLPRDSSVHEEARKFDENAYLHYELVRDRLVEIFEDVSIQYLRTPFVGNQEEIECIGKVYDIGLQLKNEERDQTYIVLDQTTSSADNNQANPTIPSISKHPARFTVHLPADFNSPYNNVMEINDDDDDAH